MAIGWNELGDLSEIQDIDSLKKLYAKIHPDRNEPHIANVTGQIWSFLKRIQIGNLVAVPLKTRKPYIKFGEVTSDYKFKKYSDDVKHIRSVKWLGEIMRSEIPQDILFSLGAFLTVGQVRATDDAEDRMRKLLKNPRLDDEILPEPKLDLEQFGRDQIVKIIRAKFLGHNLAILIDEILRARGYVTRLSPPGRDHGVDILAGSGVLGFDDPKICVQVKSQKDPVDIIILHHLVAVSKKFKATHSILVAWGGLKGTAIDEIKEQFFSTKLWDYNTIIDEILKNYDKLSDETKSKIPLKKIWAVIGESDQADMD